MYVMNNLMNLNKSGIHFAILISLCIGTIVLSAISRQHHVCKDERVKNQTGQALSINFATSAGSTAEAPLQRISKKR